MLTPLLLFVHITVMFTAITVGFGGGLVMRMAYMTGQVAAVRGVGMALARLSPWIPILFIVGGVFGLLTAITWGIYSLTAPWLLIAYALFIAAMAIGILENAPWGKRMGALLAQTPDGPLTPEVKAMFTETRVVVLTIVDYLIVAAIIFDMVVKPFS
jgi:hypothetical protein